jgi:hypothetical protein
LTMRACCWPWATVAAKPSKSGMMGERCIKLLIG